MSEDAESDSEMRPGHWIVMGILFAVVAALVWVNWGARRFVNSDRHSPLNNMIHNLRIIEGAKDQWALEEKKSPGDLVTIADITPYLKNHTMFKSIQGETYNLNPLGIEATATLPPNLFLGPIPNGGTVSIP